MEFFDGLKVHKIWCGYDSSFAQLDDGRVFAWGNNIVRSVESLLLALFESLSIVRPAWIGASRLTDVSYRGDSSVSLVFVLLCDCSLFVGVI